VVTQKSQVIPSVCYSEVLDGWEGEGGSEAYDADGPTHGRKSAIFLALAKEPGVCVGVTKRTMHAIIDRRYNSPFIISF